MFPWWRDTEINGHFTVVLNVPSVKLSLNAFENHPIVATSKVNCLYLGNPDCTCLVDFKWHQCLASQSPTT